MPFRNIKLIPGVNTQLTPTLNEMGWTSGTALMRFTSSASGQPEAIGGWKLQNAVQLTGAPRGVMSWSTLPGTITAGVETPLVAIGSEAHLYVWDFTTAHDITPVAPPLLVDSIYGSWFLDHWGEELVGVRGASPPESLVGTTIYNWKPASGYGTPAAAISGAPANCNGCLVSANTQQLIAWGVNANGAAAGWTGAQDPMFLAWSDYSNYNTWIPSATNAAGGFRLTQGSKIMAIVPAQGQMLVFTDSAVYSMQFLGGQLIYGFQLLGTNCGLIAPRAVVTIGGIAYWWSNTGNFFTYDGVVRPVTCPVRNLCLDTILPTAPGSWIINASSNSRFSEVRFDFPVANGLEARNYVSTNVLNNTWGYGEDSSGISVGRTAMTDYVPTVGAPIGLDRNGNIWLQETGSVIDKTVISGGQTIIPWILQSGYADISGGENFMFIDSAYPDSTAIGTGVNLSIYVQAYPTDSPTILGPFECGQGIREIPCRERGRQIAVNFTNVGNLNPWRLGLFRTRVASDGRR